jgi:hypothetical protein
MKLLQVSLFLAKAAVCTLTGERHLGRCLIAVLFAFASFSHEVFGADYPNSDTFLIVGEMSSPTPATGKVDSPGSEFLVAVTPSRVLVGWVNEKTTPLDASLKNDLEGAVFGRCRQVFILAALNLSHSVSLECSATNGPDILQPSSRSLNFLVRQRPIREVTFQELMLHAITGPFNDCPLAFFAQDPTLNLGRRRFCDLAEAGEGIIKNEYCEVKLLAPDDRGHQSLLVSQKSVDQLNIDSTLKLVEATSKFYPSGMESIRTTCEFDRRVKDLGKAPWTARMVHESVGKNGKSIIQNRLVSVNKVVTEPREVDKAIDRIVQLIPDGERIITDGKIELRWKNGLIEGPSDPPKR